MNPPNPPSTRNARTPETTKKQTPNAVTFRLKDDRREAAHVLPDLGVWPRRERWAVDLLKESEHVGSAVGRRGPAYFAGFRDSTEITTEN